MTALTDTTGGVQDVSSPRGGMRRVGLVVVLGLLGLGLGFGAWYLASDPRRGRTPVATDQVLVTDTAFEHPVITVPAGTRVTWTFDDVEEHNVATDDWASDVMFTGTYAHTFETPGTVDYVCSLHPLSMRARVLVTP